MDPVILANILTAIAIIVIGGPLAWLALRWLIEETTIVPFNIRARLMDAAHKRARLTAGQKIIAGLEDAVAHARGDSSRAKITRPKAHETGSWRPAGVGADDIFKPWRAGD